MSKKTAPKKSLGQHWLRDIDALNAIAAAAEIEKTDTILEVGPGLGTLTEVLVEASDSVIAVEYDAALAADLPNVIPSPNLTAINADILDYNLAELPTGYKVVANIPYYLTSHLVRRLLEADNQPSLIVLLVQKEVARRIVAKPGQMSILAVAAQFYAECSLGVAVPAELFEPPPKVDSQVVILRPKKPMEVDLKSFFRIVRAGFSEKRKKLSNSLAGGLQLEKSDIEDRLKELGFGQNTRAQEIGIEDWIKIYKRFKDVD